MKKKTFLITIPMTYTLEIEAENEKEALDIYCNMEPKELDEECDISEYPDIDGVEIENYDDLI